MAVKCPAVSTDGCLLQLLSSAGVTVLSTLPARSTATHSGADVQETPVSSETESIGVREGDQVTVGLVEVSTYPARSTATHSDGDSHETPVGSRLVPDVETSCAATDHVPSGSVLARMLPSLSVAAQSVADGHETPVIGLSKSTGCTWTQPDSGSAELTTPPALSEATQRESDAHETAVRSALGSMLVLGV